MIIAWIAHLSLTDTCPSPYGPHLSHRFSSVSLLFLQVFFVESICEDPQIIAENIKVSQCLCGVCGVMRGCCEPGPGARGWWL